MWESRAFCGISKRGGDGGKVGGKTFPPFPPRVISTVSLVRTALWSRLLREQCFPTLGDMRDQDWTKILAWPGYRVYRQEINEKAKTLKLWVRRKPGNQKLVCCGCGQKVPRIRGIYEREIRDLPCFEFQTIVVVELYRVDCLTAGLRRKRSKL